MKATRGWRRQFEDPIPLPRGRQHLALGQPTRPFERGWIGSVDKAAYKRFKRMEAAWLALAEEQDWLDGERSPVDPNAGLKAKI